MSEVTADDTPPTILSTSSPDDSQPTVPSLDISKPSDLDPIKDVQCPNPSPPPQQDDELAKEISVAVSPIPGMDEKNHIKNILSKAEKEFKECVEELMDDDVLSKFRTEHEKLFRSLKKSVLNGMNMFEQYTTLHRIFHENISNSKHVSESASLDETTIRSLKGQIKRATEFLETSRLKEEKAKDELRQLRIETNDLKATLTHGVGLSTAQERSVNNLMLMKEEALRDLETETNRIVHLRSKIADIAEKTKSVDSDRRSLEAETRVLKERIAARKLDIDAEIRIRDNLESDLRDTRQVVSIKFLEVKERQDSVNQQLEDIALLQNQVKSQKQMLEKSSRDHENLLSKVAKYKEQCDEQISTTNALLEQNNGSLDILHMKEAELQKVTGALDKTTKIRGGLQKKIRLLETKRCDAESNMRKLEDDSSEVIQKIEQYRIDADHFKRMLEDLGREQKILSTNLKKLHVSTEADKQALLLLQQTRTNMEQEQQLCIRLVKKRQAELLELEDQKASYQCEITEHRNALEQMQHTIKEKEAQVYQQKKSAVELETRLKHQQNMYETAQADRNLHARNLIESQKEITEMKRQLRIMTFSINGLKEGLTLKQDEITRELANGERLSMEMEAVSKEIENMKHKIELSQAYARHQVTEETNLSQSLQDAETEKQRQEHSLAMAISERDRLSEQLTKQDGELLNVYNDIKTGQFALLRSQKHYLKKVHQIKDFKTQVRRLAQEQRIMKLTTRDHDYLKQAVHQLKAELLGEQAHIKLLSDQLNIPVNIHRWRKLEGSDPEKLESIQLSQSLQRAILDKSAEGSAKEAKIAEKEQIYLQLKDFHARQIGVEAYEQVLDLNRAIKEKQVNLKHMQTEVNMYRAQIKEHKYNISGLDRQLHELKALYFEQRRLEQSDTKYKNHKSDRGKSGANTSDAPIDFSFENKSEVQSRTTRLTPSVIPDTNVGTSLKANLQVVELPRLPQNNSMVSMDSINDPSTVPIVMDEKPIL